MAHGADRTAKNNAGKTAADLAVEGRQSMIAIVLALTNTSGEARPEAELFERAAHTKLLTLRRDQR